MCSCSLRSKKHIILPILYIIVAPLCSAFLKRVDLYKAHRSEKRGVLWLASYPVPCDWPNTSIVRRKCYAPHRFVMRDDTKILKSIINEAFVVSSGDIMIIMHFHSSVIFFSFVMYCNHLYTFLLLIFIISFNLFSLCFSNFRYVF